MLVAWHPLGSHLMGSGAIEMLFGGCLGFCFGRIQGRHTAGVRLNRSRQLQASGDADEAEQLGKPSHASGLNHRGAEGELPQASATLQ